MSTPAAQQQNTNPKMAQNAALNFIATVRKGGVNTLMYGMEHLVVTAIGAIMDVAGAGQGLALWNELVVRCDNALNEKVKAITEAKKPKIMLNS